MRTTITAGAIAVTLGLTGLLPSPAAAVPGPGDAPILHAVCPEPTGCVVPEPDPDPKVDPDLPGGQHQLIPIQPDPCLTELLCPPEPDPTVNPGIEPDFDDLVTEKPCVEMLEPCPGGGGGGGGDDQPQPDPGDDPEDQPQPDPDDDPEDQPQPGDDPEDQPDPADSTVDIDAPRPGLPTFTG
jgi:hypothetical protein